MGRMSDNVDFKNFVDPLMTIFNSLELINLQYKGVMDGKVITYLNRIERSSRKIESLLKELESKHKVYNK